MQTVNANVFIDLKNRDGAHRILTTRLEGPRDFPIADGERDSTAKHFRNKRAIFRRISPPTYTTTPAWKLLPLLVKTDPSGRLLNVPLM